MSRNYYLVPPDDYFWEWDENLEYISIVGGNTIAHRKLIYELTSRIAPNGLPPFGAFVLVVVATNPNSTASFEQIEHIIKKDSAYLSQSMWSLDEAKKFFETLAALPQAYKEGHKKQLVFEAIFEKAHNRTTKGSAYFVHVLGENTQNMPLEKTLLHNLLVTGKKTQRDLGLMKASLLKKDLITFGILNRHFKTPEDILYKIAKLSEIATDEKTPILDIIEKSKLTEKSDFLTEILADERTFYVAALIKYIWGGLKIPFHSNMPSAQPIGGVSDLTNKGDFDRLLISEYANDDLVFLSRLANNEALYLEREIPPQNNDFQRFILIDTTLKNWGTPKTMAFALMLAIEKHPKAKVQSQIFAIGKHYKPIKTSNIHELIDALQLLDNSIDASAGLTSFFQDFGHLPKTEIFFITEKTVFNQSAMLKIASELQERIKYWIFTDTEGNINMYQKQQKTRKHLQHFRLPLSSLWEVPKMIV